jgi:hypothetical protein
MDGKEWLCCVSGWVGVGAGGGRALGGCCGGLAACALPSARYCSRPCQSSRWAAHKQECGMAAPGHCAPPGDGVTAPTSGGGQPAAAASPGPAASVPSTKGSAVGTHPHYPSSPRRLRILLFCNVRAVSVLLTERWGGSGLGAGPQEASPCVDGTVRPSPLPHPHPTLCANRRPRGRTPPSVASARSAAPAPGPVAARALPLPPAGRRRQPRSWCRLGTWRRPPSGCWQGGHRLKWTLSPRRQL